MLRIISRGLVMKEVIVEVEWGEGMDLTDTDKFCLLSFIVLSHVFLIPKLCTVQFCMYLIFTQMESYSRYSSVTSSFAKHASSALLDNTNKIFKNCRTNLHAYQLYMRVFFPRCSIYCQYLVLSDFQFQSNQLCSGVPL